MNLLEYEAKSILKAAGMPVPSGVLVDHNDYDELATISLPCVIKSQVPTGGRGKLGGVRVVKNTDELRWAVSEIFKLKIKGLTPRILLCEELIDIDRELYLSLIIDRAKATVDLVAHPDGGMEIESQRGFMNKSLDGHNFKAVGEALAELYGLETKAFVIQELIEKLYRCFNVNDITMLEINPLILTKRGTLVVGDCKIILDNDASFRHPDWSFEQKLINNNFVALDHSGTVGTMANGAGLAMATVDAVEAAGLCTANFLDIGGTASTKEILSSLRLIVALPNVSAIVINIFGGILRCDNVAKAILKARSELPNLPPLYIRLTGNHSLEAAAILRSAGLRLYDNLNESLEMIKDGA